MKKVIEWFKESNRYKHLGLGFAYGLGANDTYCAIYGGIGVSGALEFKDWQCGGKPDWVDFLLTFAGVMAGYTSRTLALNYI